MNKVFVMEKSLGYDALSSKYLHPSSNHKISRHFSQSPTFRSVLVSNTSSSYSSLSWKSSPLNRYLRPRCHGRDLSLSLCMPRCCIGKLFAEECGYFLATIAMPRFSEGYRLEEHPAKAATLTTKNENGSTIP